MKDRMKRTGSAKLHWSSGKLAGALNPRVGEAADREARHGLRRRLGDLRRLTSRALAHWRTRMWEYVRTRDRPASLHAPNKLSSQDIAV